MLKKEFIETLYKKRSVYTDNDQAEMMANLLDTVSSDIYSESQRFIFELIQNADDAAQTDGNEILFDFHTDYLLVSHKGKPFDELDILAITNAGKGTKGADSSKTGYKGIGFKSVFGKSNKVAIFSNGYNFRFDRQHIGNSFDTVKMPWQIIPIWTDETNFLIADKTISCTNQYNVSTLIELKNINGLRNELNELLSDGKILLFLRRITKISISINGEPQSFVEKSINKNEKYFNEISLKKDKLEISNWIVKSFDNIPIDSETQSSLKQDDKTPDKLKETKTTEISFAAKIENGRIKSLKGEESLIFTYLPTKVIDFEFPFLVNGSFLTNASREGIHEDRFWNQWLFGLIAEKIFDWLEMLSSSKYKYQILHLLPVKFSSFQNDLKAAFNSAYESCGRLKPFVPNKQLNLKKASDILIDKTGLSEEEFISTQALIDFVNSKQEKKFTSDSFAHSALEQKHKLNLLGAQTFALENLEEFFINDTFKSTHQPDQNINLIRYFFDKANQTDSRLWNEKLKTIPFIYAKGKKLKSPQTLCFPSIGFETEFGDGVSVIHSEVYQKLEEESKLRKWLEHLGVKEPSDLAYLENEIIGNIGTIVTTVNYKTITRYLLNQHKKGILEYWHYRKLEELKLFTSTKELISAKQCYLSDAYGPILKLEKINKLGKYVSESYKEHGDLFSEWKTFLLKIGVSESIDIQTITTNRQHSKITGIELQYFEEVATKAKENHNYPHLVDSSNDIELEKIRLIEFAHEYQFSKEFWKATFETINPNIVKHDGRMEWGYYGSICLVDNYFYWSLKNSVIFPTTKRNCLKAKEIFINEKDILEIAGHYLPVFACEIVPDSDWRKLIPMKLKLELEDYLAILAMIAKETENDEDIRLSKIRKIGLIYNKLSAQISGSSIKTKNRLSDWANENKLLCSSGNFESPKELKWVKISGFTNKSERLKLIHIPENCETNSSDFESLLDAIGIQIIDSFLPEITNPKPDTSLLRQLHIILPYLVAIIERKRYVNYIIEHQRISDILESLLVYNASKIILSFKNQEELISGPCLNAYRAENNLYFKGNWKNPITRFALVPELATIFEISGFHDEITLFLELTQDEIRHWLTENGYNIESIPEPEIDQFNSANEAGIVSSALTSHESSRIQDILNSKNITLEQLIQLIENLDADEDESGITYSTTSHLTQKGKNEENEIARQFVFDRLTREGFEFTQGKGENSVVNGVFKDGLLYPLVIKSYRNDSYKFNIRPNEWLQLSKPNAMFWVHRGSGQLEVLKLDGLLRANSEFHIQFETAAFSLEGLVKFAEVFRFVKNVHFQLDSPNFSIANSFEEYKFDQRDMSIIEHGKDNQELLR